MFDGGEPSPLKRGYRGRGHPGCRMQPVRQGDIGVVGGRGGKQSYLPPLSRCGHKEGTLGSPAGRKAGRVGGEPLQFNAEMRGL